MALADWTAFLAALRSPRDIVGVTKRIAPATNTAGKLTSHWVTSAPLNGAAPTTAAVPTKATTGAFPFDAWQNSGGSFATYCLGGDLSYLNTGSESLVGATLIVCDRLSHQGGLSGTATGAQTTNLPTAALTRYTSGVGVMAALEIYTQLGATPTTITASYTNQAAASGQTTPAVVWGATANREAGLIIPLPLQVGDTGVQAVANVNAVGSTGSVGNFGVTLFKPLMTFSLDTLRETAVDPVLSGRMGGGMPEIIDDACLFFLLRTPGTGTYAVGGSLSFAEA